MGFVEFSSVFGVGFVILELFGCCVFCVCEPLFVGMNSNPISPSRATVVLQGTMTPILWWGHLMELMMTDSGSSVMVRREGRNRKRTSEKTFTNAV